MFLGMLFSCLVRLPLDLRRYSFLRISAWLFWFSPRMNHFSCSITFVILLPSWAFFTLLFDEGGLTYFVSFVLKRNLLLYFGLFVTFFVLFLLFLDQLTDISAFIRVQVLDEGIVYVFLAIFSGMIFATGCKSWVGLIFAYFFVIERILA